MKNKWFWAIFCLVFLYTLYVELSSLRIYPSFSFQHFKREWAVKNELTLYSRQLKREISIPEIIAPNEMKVFAFLIHMSNKHRAATISYLNKKWEQKHPTDSLIVSVKE